MASIETKQNKVTFFFVGVGKCGTSWIFEIARKKNLFSVPKIKEPYLIDQPASKHKKIVASLYQSFDRMADFSNVYYWDVENPQKIFDYNRHAKIIITIRKPSDRIISHFRFVKRNGEYKNLTLAQYLEQGDSYHLIDRSVYAPMIQRYEEVFGKSNILILPLELLKSSPQAYLDRLTEFCDGASIELSPEDMQPVLKQSKARYPIMAKFAKTSANLLRNLGMLRLLGKSKDSKLIRSVLYRESKDKPQVDDKDFGAFADQVDALDQQYGPLLKSYGLSLGTSPVSAS